MTSELLSREKAYLNIGNELSGIISCFFNLSCLKN
jgi:hypothetical protein